MFLLSDLPSELWAEIWSYLSVYEIKELAAAYPEWQDIAEEALRLFKMRVRQAVYRWEICKTASLHRSFSADGQLRDISADGTKLCMSSGNAVCIQDVKSRKRLSLYGHTDAVFSVAFGADDRCIAIGGCDKTACVWHAETGELLLELKGHDACVTSVAWSADCMRLASGSAYGTVHLWDTTTRNLLLRLKGHHDNILSIAWSHDSQRLASASCDRSVCVWNTATGKLLLQLEGHTDYVSSVAWSADDQLLASGSVDGTVRVWNTTDRTVVHELLHLGCIGSVSFAPHGDVLAIAARHGILLFSMRSFALILSIENNSMWICNTRVVKFSSDGRFLMYFSTPNKVLFYVCDIV